MSGGDPELVDSLVLRRVPRQPIIIPVLQIISQLSYYFIYELSLGQTDTITHWISGVMNVRECTDYWTGHTTGKFKINTRTAEIMML